MRGWVHLTAAMLGLASVVLGGCTPEPVLQRHEVPEILRTRTTAGWDGRETMGGLWAAHETLPLGEARLRDPAGGPSVDVLLLRRLVPGTPPLQLSSEAAKALGMEPGQSRRVEVVALRLVPDPGPEAEPAPTLATAPRTPDPATPLPRAEPRPVIVATFAREDNARAAAARLRVDGIAVQVVALPRTGPPLWQLRARPATPAREGPLLAKVKAAGFADAYLLPQ